MFGLGKLWSALANLAANLDGLSATVHEVNGNLRAALHLDTVPPRGDFLPQPSAAGALVEVQNGHAEPAPAEADAGRGRKRK